MHVDLGGPSVHRLGSGGGPGRHALRQAPTSTPNKSHAYASTKTKQISAGYSHALLRYSQYPALILSNC
jgi:hypothetical protein